MLRTLYQSDVPQLLVIENSIHITPWTNETFQACLQAGYIGWVLEIEDPTISSPTMGKKIIGFIMISQTPEECHILNIGVARDYQRLGWGQTLLEHCLNHAKQHHIGIAYLEVRATNTKAIALYKKLKFQQIDRRRNYYPTVNGYEDALIFAMNLDSWNG